MSSGELATTDVVVLLGGTSSEREVSLSSGKEILAALRDEGGLQSLVGVEIAADGRWLIDGRPLEPTAALAQLPARALYFLGLHGGQGENGTLQGFLEVARKRYTGSGVSASALCMHKQAARAVFAAAGLRVAPGRFVRAPEWAAARAEELDGVTALGPGPWYLKPEDGGSSVMTFVAKNRDDLERGLDRIFAAGSDALVEQEVPGVELTVGVLGNRGGELTALPAVEIQPKPGRFFDYEEKYGTDGAREFCPPHSLPADHLPELNRLALRAYAEAGCDGYARIDFMWPRDPDGHLAPDPVVLEANTLPGFTSRSLLPQAAAASGLDFRALCLRLCELAIERFRASGREW